MARKSQDRSVAWSSGGAISWLEGTAVLQSDLVTLAGTLRKATGATLASGAAASGEFYGQITDLNVSATYNLSNGNASFTGNVTRQSVGVANTSLTQLRNDGTFNVTDYITIDGISANVNSRSIIDFYAGDDAVTLSGSVGTMFYAGAGNDTISGSASNDFINGESGTDTYVVNSKFAEATVSYSEASNRFTISSSSGGRDEISNIEFFRFSDRTVPQSDLIPVKQNFSGSSADDSFSWTSATGSVQISGGPGRDKITIAGLKSEYEVSANSISKSGAVASLSEVERVKFQDVSIAFDVNENAGKAYRVYKAAFARDPMAGDKAGLGFWISRIDGGMDMVEVAARFIDSPEFRTLYGQNPSNADFLTKVYTNVLGRSPDPGGYDWWLNQLNTNPEKTRQKVLADFSESQENKDSVATLVGSGIQYIEYSS